MRKIPIITGDTYHVCNRSVEKINIFGYPKECLRFLQTALLVNNSQSTPPNWQFRNNIYSPTPGVGEKLIDIYALALMPNHFHFLVRQLVDNGLSYFFQRLCNSFGKYFNQKNERVGPLFIGRYKAVRIESNQQAAHMATYIHSNPLDLIEPGWREKNIKNWPKAEKFLINYQWFSFGVYCTKAKTHNSINQLINKKFLENYYDNSDDHLNAIKNWGIPYPTPGVGLGSSR